MNLGLIFIIPAAFMALGLFLRRLRPLCLLHNIGYFAVLAQSFLIFYKCCIGGNVLCAPKSIFLIDPLSSFFLLTITLVSFSASLYSGGYLALQIKNGVMDLAKVKSYYLIFDLFVLAMFFTVCVNNVGFMWIAIEMTTLISAFLVGFYRTKESIEAAWKYLVICSVGIIIALVGTILFYLAFERAGGARGLNWTDIYACAKNFDKNLVKIAFLFIFVGYGTKAGIAPMHTWLPDAHSQAISPISALLSGVLLKTALYAIIRFGMILNLCLGEKAFFGNILTFFGLVCLGVSCGLIFVQKDIKRLLAYSSIEHIGVICVGLGIGGAFGLIGALAHIFNHAVTKSLMFFSAGRIVSHYGKHNMNSLYGVINAMPFCGVVFLLGTFALIGFPPFSIFASEFLIIMAAFLRGSYLVAALTLVFLALAFAAIIMHFSNVAFGKKPQGVEVASEPLSIKAAFLLLLAVMALFGIGLPIFIKAGIFSKLVSFLGA